MPMSDPVPERVRIGIVSVSDRASSGVYEDKGLPALKDWLTGALLNPIEFVPRLIPDEQAGISAALVELVDDERCDLVLTTGGTGPAPRDVTPEATLAIAETLAGHEQASGIFAAVPYCIDLIGGPYLETRDEVCPAFRPKSARRPSAA